jgi:hypothetical protein
MTQIRIDIDESCEYCNRGLAYLKELKKHHPGCYGTRILDTGKYVPGLLLLPDYNSFGILTHFHIKREEAPE